MANNGKSYSTRENGFFTPRTQDGAPLFDENGEPLNEKLDYGIGQNYIARTAIGDTNYFELPNKMLVPIDSTVTFTMGAPIDGLFHADKASVIIVDGAGNPTGDEIAFGATRKVNYVQSIGEERYYAVGLGLFVKVSDGSFSTEQTVNPPEPIVASGQVHYIPGFGIHVWTLNHEHVKTTTGSDLQVRHGTRVRIEAKAQIGDSTYYKIGDDRWIDAAYVEIIH